MFDLFREHLRALVIPTKPQFARVDAIGITKFPEAAFFIETMARRVSKGRFDSTMFDKGQYEAIRDLHKSIGLSTYLVVTFTDAIGYIELPDDRAITAKEGAKWYLSLKRFKWFEAEIAEAALQQIRGMIAAS